MLGQFEQKHLILADKKCFLCTNAQIISMLSSINYRRIHISEHGLIQPMNYKLNDCLSLAWTKIYFTKYGKVVNCERLKGTVSLVQMNWILRRALTCDKRFCGDWIWNSNLNTWIEVLNNRDKDKHGKFKHPITVPWLSYWPTFRNTPSVCSWNGHFLLCHAHSGIWKFGQIH